MRLIFDCRPETMYPLAKEGFSGGSQVYVKAIIRGLVANGHEVHVIAADLEEDERRGPNEFWWPPDCFPKRFDVAIMMMHARENPEYEAPFCILMTSCIDPWLGPDNAFANSFDAVPVFSQVHKDLLCQARPIPPEKCHMTGLGVELKDYFPPEGSPEYSETLLYAIFGDMRKQRKIREEVAGRHSQWRDKEKVPGRLLYGNDPARGLFYMLDIFDKVKARVPYATLHVTYDFDTQHSWRAWEHSQMAEMLWDCKRRLETTPGVVNLGGLDRAGIIREQLECQVHCAPQDPPGVGTQTHGIMQMECAAAGAALVLSDVEAFPEVFGAGAKILPVIGKFLPQRQNRCDAGDYAEVVISLMKDPRKWATWSRKARALAERNTWSAVVTRWETMLAGLKGEAVV